ncbi:Hypothetical protein A7982_03748 [Minicystis rosea]|nr:Hypothetical protein A7982_03748 [Minicystis rosea]
MREAGRALPCDRIPSRARFDAIAMRAIASSILITRAPALRRA